MSRQQEISKGNQLVAAKLNYLKGEIGTLTGLSTTDKSSLVAAINEVKAIADSAAGGGAVLNDGATNSTEGWTSTKIVSEITSRIANALEGEDLSDISDQIAALIQADNGLVSATANQSFNAAQQEQARTNIGAASAAGVGDVNFDFAAEITALLSF